MNDPSPPPVPQARILIVDDESTARMAISRALNLMGYWSDEACSGNQALEKLSAYPYDLMLLDLHMPGIDGVEVMKRVQKTHPNLLVIVLTAHASVDSAIAAVRVGAADYLLKPCKIVKIADVIANALERRRERLHRQHLIGVMSEALDALRAEEEDVQRPPDTPVSSDGPERFLQSGPIALDRQKRLVVVSGTHNTDALDAELTANEAALLAHLMQRPDVVLSCRELARGALDYDVTEREAQDVVRPHISRLRKKIEPDPAHSRLIRTIRGKGYIFFPHPS